MYDHLFGKELLTRMTDFSLYKYLLVFFIISHLGFQGGNLVLLTSDPGLCLLLYLFWSQPKGFLIHMHLTWPRGYKSFFMLSSAETKIYPAHKC